MLCTDTSQYVILTTQPGELNTVPGLEMKLEAIAHRQQSNGTICFVIDRVRELSGLFEICRVLEKFHPLTLVSLAAILSNKSFTQRGKQAFPFFLSLYIYAVRSEGCGCTPSLRDYSVEETEICYQPATSGVGELSIFAGPYTNRLLAHKGKHINRVQRDFSTLLRPVHVSLRY